MKQLAVADDVYEQITLLARAWTIGASDVISRLLSDFRGAGVDVTPTRAELVNAHAIYAGVRTEGMYSRAGKSLTITSGPLAGETFSKPSPAAVALVAALRPGVHPNRNGWSFWLESSTGRPLQAIRYEEPAES